MTGDRRENPRIDLRFKVTIRTIRQGIHEMKNLSVGWLFIRTTDTSIFVKGSDIQLVMREPATSKLMRLKARVVHVGGNGIGVEFFDVKPSDRRAMEYCFSLAFLVSPFPHLVGKIREARGGIEKRKNPRIDIQLPVETIVQHDRPEMVKDLSVEGLFIEIPNPSEFRVKDAIELVMHEPADNKLVHVKARVAHVGETGIGVEFFDVTPEDQEALKTCFDVFQHTLPKVDG